MVQKGGHLTPMTLPWIRPWSVDPFSLSKTTNWFSKLAIPSGVGLTVLSLLY